MTNLRADVAPRVGFVGAGQLARMAIQAAIPLGVDVSVLAVRPDDAAALVTPHVLLGSPASLPALSRLANASDVVTFDHELVDAALLRRLEEDGHRLRPSPAVMAVAQDKVMQHELFDRLGFPVPPWTRARSLDDIERFAGEYGWPVVLKARRGGYDGRGVWVVPSASEAAGVWLAAGAAGLTLLVEQWARIEREVAVMVARRPTGESAAYPVVETVQVDGMCREIIAPAPVAADLAEQATEMALHLAETIGLAGVLALELFVVDGRLVMNEIAARPHNSGHYTIEGCETSQFENHLRGVLDWPLGATSLTASAVATVNVVGRAGGPRLATALPAALAVPGVHVHLYGKAARPGRKLGHVTALGGSIDETLTRARRAADLLMGPCAPEPQNN